MALALRLRRALAAASTSAPLLRPAASAAVSPSRSLLPAPLAPSLPRRFLPGGAAGFRSTAAAAARGNYGGGADDSHISPDEILFEGCDYKHWLITMEFPDPKPSREEMIETYLNTLAKVVGSYEEAKKRMYALSTTTYVGFQAEMSEEMSEKFRGLPGVVFILPDSYLFPETKEYGGDKYENGVITPRAPPTHYSKPSRTDRNRSFRGNYQDNPPPQGNYPRGPPPQGNYQDNPPPRGNYNSGPPPQGNFQPYRPPQDGRGYNPQQSYAQAGQDGRGYARNNSADRSGYNGPPAPGAFEGQVNQPGQGYQNPQEVRNFSQGQAGDFRSGGPPAPGTYGQPSGPGTYGQPSGPGTYGQPPAPTYPGGNQGGPGTGIGFGGDNRQGAGPAYGGDNRQGAGPAYGGDNLHGGSGQYSSPGEGQQGNWQGRQ
ncbi:multiple organellar RNA editing factor 1, mitochondrial-like [Lolium rigidum]|uniref:multiple organellar RNA editing factor 1, mitochondrial-like n=1 Tax=Lolium rigidum TaxID=89674 RepID=UPI001F5DE66B|nr:multiple organellar RNA editing factor 1, mitochondrial-like [Lolium rigidum]